MPRRLAVGSAQDLVQAERDIRARIGGQELASLVRRIIRTVEGDQAPAGG